MDESKLGKIGWCDLTVANAVEVRDFYQAVVGWTSEGVDMDGYEDFVMMPAQGEGVAGVCHARGPNADLPPVWIVYFVVADLEQSLSRAESLGGTRVGEIRRYEQGGFCVVRDPAGAHFALYQS